MIGALLGLIVAVFLACVVEAVEALTIVLAIGLTRGWRPALTGAGAGLLCLTAVVSVLGPAITSIPLGVLRTVIGGLLLIFGLQWLRKAILRTAGRSAMHDELASFERTRRAAAADPNTGASHDRYATVVCFKAVLLEGLEVAFIVVTFGASQHHVAVAAFAAGVAVLGVCGIGFALREPLAQVPENSLKLTVGILMSAFGIFWSAEGAGSHWPGGEAALLVLIPGVAAVAMLCVARLRTAPRRLRRLW